MIQAAQHDFPADFIAITDPAMLSARARALNLPLKIIETSLDDLERPTQQPHTLRVHPVHFPKMVETGVLALGKRHDRDRVIGVRRQSLPATAGRCPSHRTRAKKHYHEAGMAFTGHTEFLAEQAGVKQTVMLFVIDQLKAAIVTTHLPLKRCSRSANSRTDYRGRNHIK